MTAASVTEIVEALAAQRSVGFGLLDADLRFVAVTPGLAEMNEPPVEDMVGRSVAEVWPDAAEPLEPVLQRALAGEAVPDIDFEAGERRFVVSYLPLDLPPAVIAVVVVEHTRAQREAQVQIRIAQHRLALALEGTETGTFEWDAATGELRWSENLGLLWGQPRGWQPAGYEAYLETLHPHDREAMSAVVSRALETGTGYALEFRCLWPDGSSHWVETRVHVVEASGGAPVLAGLVIDIDERRRRELAAEFLSRASLALSETLDVRATLQHVAELALPELADWCAVSIVARDGAVEQLAVAHPDPERETLARRLQEQYPTDPHAPTGVPAVVRTGRSELYPEITDAMLAAGARDAEHLELMRALQLRSLMIVPMVARGRTIGAITFLYAGSGRAYGTMELELAEELGRRAGLAIDNARLHRAERESHRRLSQLQAITDVALTHLDLDELLAELLGRLPDVVGARSARVLLADPDRGELVVRASRGPEAGELATTRIPLRAAGQMIGELQVTTEAEDGFGRGELDVLERAADRVGLAIDHARLYESMRDTAVTLQRSLLPPALPPLEGMTAAVRYLAGQHGTEVGGDWYDLFPSEDGRLVVAVGDVAGRGVQAAAGMGQLRGALRAYAATGGDPSEALRRLDAFMAGLGGVGFATVALLSLDTGTGELTLCLAGHPPPVVWDGAGTAHVIAAKAGPPIGAGAVERPTCTLTLSPGESLLLYTDGLIERRGTLIDDRIRQLAGAVAAAPAGHPEALADHVLAEMLAGATTRDDVALVALRRDAAT